VYWTPSTDREWTFWQFTDKAKLDGYEGDEPCIDVNVFCGTEEEFEKYGK
jgi:lysozyme